MEEGGGKVLWIVAYFTSQFDTSEIPPNWHPVDSPEFVLCLSNNVLHQATLFLLFKDREVKTLCSDAPDMAKERKRESAWWNIL